MVSRSITGGLLAAFVALAPRPAQALAVLSSSPTADPTAAGEDLLAAVALLGWALLLWLGGVVLALVAARTPGTLGALCGRLAAAIAPAAVRRGLALALGLGLTAGSPAAWAAGGSSSGGPALDWPVAVSTPVAASATAAALTAPAAYVVQPGDSLWTIAARQLPPGAAPARVAAAWPAWWQANRSQLGPDPDLIHPGTRLTPPSEKE